VGRWLAVVFGGSLLTPEGSSFWSLADPKPLALEASFGHTPAELVQRNSLRPWGQVVLTGERYGVGKRPHFCGVAGEVGIAPRLGHLRLNSLRRGPSRRGTFPTAARAASTASGEVGGAVVRVDGTAEV
jgi:hypothetical protein